MLKEKIVERKIRLGNQEVLYHHHIKRVKNLNLRIKTDGTVHISTSSNVPIQVIERFMKQKSDFILAAVEKMRPREKKKYFDGEVVHFLGRAFTLRLKTRAKRSASLNFNSRELILFLPDIENIEARRKEVFRWEKSAAEEIFPEVMEKMIDLFADENLVLPKLKYRRMKSRWGSCNLSDKAITLNTMLVEAPVSVIEYVIVHELAHLVHPNHSKEFYQLVACKMPDWKTRRQLLKDFFGYQDEL